MNPSWNFERRRDTCARFLIGVSVVVNGVAGQETSLEAVRNRMRLSPEEALFAARRLHEEARIVFEKGGAIQSTALGIERAEELKHAVRSKCERVEEADRLVRNGGTELGVVAAVISAHGGTLACGPPDEPSTHRLVLVRDAVTLERGGAPL